MATAMDDFDALVACTEGTALSTWLTRGRAMAGEPVRCPVTEDDDAARGRLDLALRMLHGQEPSQWCRPAGAATAVVRRWCLPATGVALHTDEGPIAFVLAVGRAGGSADVWRFRFDVPSHGVIERGRELLLPR